jgi:hypothetical protein
MCQAGHFRPWYRRFTAALIGAALATSGTVCQPRDAPFDKTRYEAHLPLTARVDPDELAAAWQDEPVVLEDVYLAAEGPRANEIYASSCAGRRHEGEEEVLEARCPSVYLGKLAPDDALRLLPRVANRKVKVYLTVGQVVPRLFASQFGMLESKDGAWVEIDDEYFHIPPDVRVFRLPEAEAAAEETAPPEPVGPPQTAEEALAHFVFRYRLIHEQDGEEVRTGLRPLGRTSLLRGRTEFAVGTTAPEWYEIESITVTGREGIYLRGGRVRLCRSTTPPGSCTVDFGPGIAGQRFRIEVSARETGGGWLTVARDFVTLDTHPDRIGTLTSGTLREKALVEQSPPDEVIRLVRVELVEGRGPERRVEYRVDLPPEAFRVDVAGINGATIKSVTPPAVTRPAEQVQLLVPIFFNVSPYLTNRLAGGPTFGWQDAHGGLVRKLQQGLERAAWNGVDAEFMVVDFAATARMFGPFRLHPGQRLTDEQKAQNRLTLDALVAHLRQPPWPTWEMKYQDRWVSDLSDPLFTLNDLYFRTFPGLVAALLVTDGWNNPAEPKPRFLQGLWPERLELLDRTLSRGRTEAILALLDEGRSLHDEALDRFLVAEDEESALTPEQLAAYLRGLDPGGISTLHPHRENRLPQMDALMVPSSVALRRGMQDIFSTMIRHDFGGEICRLYQVQKTTAEQLEEQLRDRSSSGDTLTFSQMIQRVHDQLRASYVVVAHIPNEKSNGARHDLSFTAVETRDTSKGRTKERPLEGRLRYMPYYTSSRSLREKLPALARSPFGLLRLLAAHELRDHWKDDTLLRLLQERIGVEADATIKKVLEESAVVIDLRRLQDTGGGQHRTWRQQAYERLQALGERADDLPDPLLARDAARAARWYQKQFGE